MGDETISDVTEKESTVKATTSDERVSSVAAEHDKAAASLIELETELDGTQTPDSSDRRSGLVTSGDRIDAASVPADYPIDIKTEQGLALTIETRDRETTAYFEWPGEGVADTRLTRLLDAMGIGLGDLYGREVLLERIDGHDVVVTPTETPRGSGVWGMGVVAGTAVTGLVLGLVWLVGDAGLSLWLPVIGLLMTVLWLPYATYKDGWFLRTHSDWDGGPLFWACAAAIPVVNILFGLLYLRRRTTATFFGDEPSLRARTVITLRSLLSP